MNTPLPIRHTTASPVAAVFSADGYKQSHVHLYPQAGSGRGDNTGTTRILINWTNRDHKYLPESTHAVVFGVQAFTQQYLTEAWAPFFAADVDEVCALIDAELLAYFGPNDLGTDHFRALHQLGYLPLRVRALPEGTLAPIGVATVTIENTHDAFYWLPNYIETALSATIWHPATVATIAVAYRDLLEDWAEWTDPDGAAGIDYQAHDFSMRGQTSLNTAAISAMGHLLSFLGSDSMGAFDAVRRYYPGPDNSTVAASVPATEHSVMCIRGPQGERKTFEQILDTFPTGIVSAVSDGYDLWKVLTDILPSLKDRIMARDGKLVIRPDSGDPVDILTGTKPKPASGPDLRTPEEKGVVELLDETFGHTLSRTGHRILDGHIGVIYGDSITLGRARRIFERLAAKGYASTNVVLGIGSYTYQLITRDSLGSAVKATYAVVDGQSVDIQKDPVTGHGKKSAKGRIGLYRDVDGEIYQLDQVTPEQEAESLLETTWMDGHFYVHQSFEDVRATLRAERVARRTRALVAA